MKLFVIRYGAYGDMIIITPLLRYLKSKGHEIVLHTSERGIELMKGNPHVDVFVPYVSSSVPDHELQGYWERTAQIYGCERIINLCESIERSLSVIPNDPAYSLPKAERRARCDKNFYEYAFTHAAMQHPDLFEGDEWRASEHTAPASSFFRPELFFTPDEEKEMENWFRGFGRDLTILWGLSGSSLNKIFPYTQDVIDQILKDHPRARIITVGDEMCQMVECAIEETVKHRGQNPKMLIKKAAKWSMRESALACRFADLVVAPDTGLLHAAGCFDTPKVGIIGSNTKNNLTKHFQNDFSIEADAKVVPCAPCFRIIYSASVQCPIEPVTSLPYCMSRGIEPKDVYERIESVMKAGKGAFRAQEQAA